MPAAALKVRSSIGTRKLDDLLKRINDVAPQVREELGDGWNARLLGCADEHAMVRGEMFDCLATRAELRLLLGGRSGMLTTHRAGCPDTFAEPVVQFVRRKLALLGRAPRESVLVQRLWIRVEMTAAGFPLVDGILDRALGDVCGSLGNVD